jgi:hypothetical protein
MGDSNDADELDPDELARFDRYYEHRQAQERKRAERRKEPKDFGEFQDRIADAVFERLADALGIDTNPDDAPSTGKARDEGKGRSFGEWFGGARS